MSETNLTQGNPGELDLTQDPDAAPVVAENWPVMPPPTTEAEDEQRVQEANPALPKDSHNDNDTVQNLTDSDDDQQPDIQI